ncbi:MAG: ribonuclease E/G [Croceibacterium sp.]
MAEWLVEEGIGEHRALQVDGDHAIAAMIEWPGKLAAGLVEDARLVQFDPRARRGLARFAGGEEALVDRLPAGSREGAAVRLEVTRAALSESGRLKRAQARPTAAEPRPAPSLAATLSARVVTRFPDGLWEDAWADAWSGEIAFPGGALLFAPTPAMTVVDVDGSKPAPQLARDAVRPIATALRLLDLGGSIAVDFPSLPDKAQRREIDRLLGEALADWPHERTAMNGFGLVQIVARLERPSLLHRLALSRAGAAARMLLRRAELVAQPGALLLTAHPAICAKLREDWLVELSRRTGREVRMNADPALALDGGFAQAVPA